MEAVRVKKLYDGTMEKPVDNATIFFDTEGVREICASTEEAGRLAEKYRITIQETETFMTPGLIDAHVHLTLPGDGTAGEDQLRQIAAEEIQMLALDNAMTALRCGVTTLRDVGSYQGMALHVRNYCRRTKKGPDILVGGMPLTSTNGHCHYMGGEADGILEIRKMIRSQMKSGIDFVKLMATAGGTKGISQADPFSLEELCEAVEESHRLGLKITMHASRINGLRKAVHSGPDGLEHCQFTDGGQIVKDQALAEEICRRNIYPCHTLAVNVAGLYSYFKEKPQELWSLQDQKDFEWQERCLELMPAQLAFQLKCGVPTIGGSDAGWKFTLFQNAMQISMEMMEQAGMNGRDIIYSCTGLCAKALGIENQTGTIKEGLQADFLLLREDPGEDIKAFYKIEKIYKNGVWVH